MDLQGPNLGSPRGPSVGCDLGSFPFFHFQSQEVSEVLYGKPNVSFGEGTGNCTLGSREGGSLLLQKSTEACSQLQLVLCADSPGLGSFVPIAFLNGELLSSPPQSFTRSRGTHSTVLVSSGYRLSFLCSPWSGGTAVTSIGQGTHLWAAPVSCRRPAAHVVTR